VGVGEIGAIPPLNNMGTSKKSLLDVNGIAFKILLSPDPSHWSGEVVIKPI